ncbi:hypothetical protein [Actinomadura chokoriensis]|uniref:Tetratricopeptide repeat protein n=1 Tax=Actinomadura chokoriensis TaxID=454156 RepID=A0ABV4R668_9ACTN
MMSAEEDGRSDDSRERRGDNGRRSTPPRRGGNARGGPAGSGDRKGGGPRGGAPRAGGPQGGRGRPAGGGWKDRDSRGKRDDRKPGRPFKRSDDRRTESREGRTDDRREGRFSGPRRERGEGRSEAPRAGQGRPGERRFAGPRAGQGRPGEGRFEGSRRSEGKPGERRFDGPRGAQGKPGERRSEAHRGGQGKPGERRFDGPRGGQGKPGERRFEGSRGGQGKPGERRFEGPRGGQGRPGERRFEGSRRSEGKPGERRFERPRTGQGKPGERRFEGQGGERREWRSGGDRGPRQGQGAGPRREGRPGDRDRSFKGRGPKRPQEGGRSYGPPRDRQDRRTRSEEHERPAPRHDDPLLPDDVTGEELDADARVELRTLPKELAAKVARHLVMAGRLAEEEPEQAYRHAKAARRLASRVGIVREAAGIAAYHTGEWAEALAELRAARRLGAGDDSYLPVMVDCERGLGRPERALDLIKSPEAEKLDPMGRVELRIVESGVRRDMGQYDAAVVVLQVPELRDRRLRPWSMRLFYAYADALVEAGRDEEAADWFARAAAADRDGDTDAAERYAELEGLHILDTEDVDVEATDAADDVTADDVTADDDVTTDDVVTDDVATDDDGGGAAAPEVASEPPAATDIAFQPAEPEVREAPEEDAPEAPAVFLEPRRADEEQPPQGD